MKKPLTIKEFLKNNKILISILVAVFVVSLVAFIITFWNTLYDVSAWGSLVSGIFTYLGSSFLGVVVFYNTQSQQRQKEIEEQISIEVKCLADYNTQEEFFIPYSIKSIDNDFYKHHVFRIGGMPIGTSLNMEPDELSYLFFSITNRNIRIPVYIEPVSIHSMDDNKKIINSSGFLLYSDLADEPIDYKQTKNCFIGTNSEILNYEYYKKHKHQVCFVLIKLRAINDEVLYAILYYILGKTLGTGKPIFITENQYEESLKKYDSPIQPYIKHADINWIVDGNYKNNNKS